MQNIYDLQSVVQRYYDAKDTMHDWTHIERCGKAASKIVEAGSFNCDQEVLLCGLILHGVIYEAGVERSVERYLLNLGMEKSKIGRIITVAWGSQREAMPDMLEGGILHDAHLLEGDDNFIITKGLVTGTARGQTLAQTVDYIFEHIAGFEPQFYLETAKDEYARRLEIARTYFESLRNYL